MSPPRGAVLDPMLARAQARAGVVLRGKWRLDRLIGVGGMAAVYQATHRNGMRGAVKMLHLEHGADQVARDRFLREGYAANKVNHPGVVRVLDDDVAEDGSVFLVMELLEGQTVDARADSQPGSKLGAAETLEIADALLGALAVAHDIGIVHRDLKPENLFLTKDGALKVLDFGIARMKEQIGSGRATTLGSAMGTPAFMPPEQASGHWDQVDARTDIWAVGATMFTLLTGRIVHEAPTGQLVMVGAITRPAPRLSTIAPELPGAVCAIVDRALAFQQSDRWSDARAMQAAVREARASISGLIARRALERGPVSRQQPIAEARATDSAIATVALRSRATSKTALIVAGITAALVSGIGILLYVTFGLPERSVRAPSVTVTAIAPTSSDPHATAVLSPGGAAAPEVTLSSPSAPASAIASAPGVETAAPSAHAPGHAATTGAKTSTPLSASAKPAHEGIW